MTRLVLFIYLIAIGCSQIVCSQGWQPAAHIRGALMWANFIQASDGKTLIPLWQVLSNQKDTLLFFSVSSMLTTPVPWHIQPPVKSINLLGVYSATDTAIDDIGLLGSDQKFHMVFDACTERQFVIDSFPRPGQGPGSATLNKYRGDLDGDATPDEFSAPYKQSFARIVLDVRS